MSILKLQERAQYCGVVLGVQFEQGAVLVNSLPPNWYVPPSTEAKPTTAATTTKATTTAEVPLK